MEADCDSIYLNKLPITVVKAGSVWNHYALVESTWGERKILLKVIVFTSIYNTPLSFLGEIAHEVLQQTAICVGKTTEEFMKETKTALCTDGGASGFSYTVEDNTFVWRKVAGLHIATYGTVTLLRSPCLLLHILQNSINVQSHLRAAIEDVAKKNETLLKIKKENDKFLEECLSVIDFSDSDQESDASESSTSASSSTSS